MSTLRKLYDETHITVENIIRRECEKIGEKISEQQIINSASQLILYEFEMAATLISKKNKKTFDGVIIVAATAASGIGSGIVNGAAIGPAIGFGLVVGAVLGICITHSIEKNWNDYLKSQIDSQGMCPPYNLNADEMPRAYKEASEAMLLNATFPERMRKRLAEAHRHYTYT